MVVAAPHTMFSFAWFDVVDFDCLCELAAVGALVVGVKFFDKAATVGPAMVVSDRVGTFAGTPSGLSARQFFSAQFAMPSFTDGFQTALVGQDAFLIFSSAPSRMRATQFLSRNMMSAVARRLRRS